ncbi:MAG: Fe-S-containing protein [bacterium]
MNEQKIKINPNYLLFGIVVTVAIAIFISFFLISSKEKPSSQTIPQETPKSNSQPSKQTGDGFLGDKGTTIQSTDQKISIDETEVKDTNIHFFNYYSEKNSKYIYFFIVKASDGTYRAAANACEVCFGAKKGFKQVGDLIRCENCQITYSKDNIAIEKGGCNPGPINKNVSVENGKLIINLEDIENVAYLF